MSLLEDILLVGTRAAQPAAATVAEGTLYSVSDEDFLIEQRDSTPAWVQYGPDVSSIVGGINQLTGDVTAGPGTGSQAATIANNAVTTVKVLDANITYPKIQDVSAADRLLGRGNGGGAGDVQEISLGTNLSLSGTVLNATGSSGAPTTSTYLTEDDETGTLPNSRQVLAGTNITFDDTTPGERTINASGGGGGDMPPVVFKPLDNEPLSTNFATLDTRNFHPVLNFDAATDETAQFSGFLPASYTGGGLTIRCIWAAATATSGDILVDVSIERNDLGGTDIDADSYAAVVTDAGTAPGTSGQLFETIHVFTSGAAMDNLVAGECFRVKVNRDANAGGDNMTGDAQLFRVIVSET